MEKFSDFNFFGFEYLTVKFVYQVNGRRRGFNTDKTMILDLLGPGVVNAPDITMTKCANRRELKQIPFWS